MKNRLFNLALKYPDKIDDINKIIDSEDYSFILNSIKKIWLKTGKVPSVESIAKTAKLNVTKEDVSSGDLVWFIEEYNKIAKMEVIHELIDTNDKDDLDIDDIYSIWNKNIIDIEPPNIITSSSMKDIFSDIDNMKSREEERIDTGFVQFNELLSKNSSSGWAKKYAYLLQGLTGTGKSFFLANIAVRAMIQGLKVAFVSVEMDQWQIRDLIYRSYFNVSNVSDIKTKRSSNYIDFELTVLNYSNMSHNMFDIQADINKLSNKPDLIVLDYLDNIAPSRTTQQSWQVHEVVGQDIIRVAQELDLPIVTATQTNRQAAGENGGTKRNVGYESTGSSFNKTHGFAGIWSIITDDNDYDENTSCRRFDLICNKNREGKQTKTSFILNYNNARLYELHEFTEDIKDDKHAKQAAQGLTRIDIGIKGESEEEKIETGKNFLQYYEKLKCDSDYKREVDEINNTYLNRVQKSKLKKKIREYQGDTV